MKGEYQVKAENLKILHQKANILLNKVEPYEFIHVKREFNKRADELATKGINSKKETVELIPEIEEAKYKTDYEELTNDNKVFSQPSRYSGKTYKYVRMNYPEYLLEIASKEMGGRHCEYRNADFIKYCMDFLKLDIEDT